jgi:uncharacterized Zn finger protein (UPF0148 family)
VDALASPGPVIVDPSRPESNAPASRDRVNPCRCGQPKVPGQGNRYCPDCQTKAQTVQTARTRARNRVWREQNADRIGTNRAAYYAKTAEDQRRRAREWHHANKDRASERNKAYRAAKPEIQLASQLRKYGLTLEDYEAMLKAQNGLCRICRTENRSSKRSRLDIDHHHRTGKVRALLCNKCNRLLSNANDDTHILLSAIQYLEETA